MSQTIWTPALGVAALVEEFGADEAISMLTRLTVGEPTPRELGTPPWPTVIRHVSRAELNKFDFRQPDVLYWPRAWAARALAYVGDEDVAPWLVRALSDDHWRVRMCAAQSLGRLRVGGIDSELLPLLLDPHPRVRAAAVTTLGLVGETETEQALLVLVDDPSDLVGERLRVALQRLSRRAARRTRS